MKRPKQVQHFWTVPPSWDELDEAEERLLLFGIRYEVQASDMLRCEVLA